MTGRKRAAAAALVLVTGLVGHRLLLRAPIVHGEEHFAMGKRLARDGVLSLTGPPSVFRPPGFPAFVAAVQRAREVLFPRVPADRAVILAHGWLLAVAAAAIFFHCARDGPLLTAVAAGALAALHPASLAVAAVLGYQALHVACVIVATVALVRAFDDDDGDDGDGGDGGRGRAAWAIGAGALWGVATLVRPISLLLPPVLFLLALGGRAGRRRALRAAALVTLGMALVIAPWTIRNHGVSGRLIAVNAQDGFQVWGLAVARDPGGGIPEWTARWREEGTRLFARATGVDYSLPALHAHAATANDAFRADALRRIGADPLRFAAGALGNPWRLHAAAAGNARSQLSRPARVLTLVVLLLGAAGLVRGLRQGRSDARVLAAVYATFVAAHAIAFLVPLYAYVLLPVALLAVPLAVPRGPVLPALALAAIATSVAAVPPAHAFREALAAQVRAPADAECAANCPDGTLTRGEAAFVLLAFREDEGYAPPPCVVPRFADVPCGHAYAPWIGELAASGAAAGCGGGSFCPDAPMSRAETAVLLLRAREWPGYAPPPCSTPPFADVPCASPYAPWIAELAARGVAGGCTVGEFCPSWLVTRRQMAVMLAETFSRTGD